MSVQETWKTTYYVTSAPSITATHDSRVIVVHSHESPAALKAKWFSLTDHFDKISFLTLTIAKLEADIAYFKKMCESSPHTYNKISKEHFEAHVELGSDQGMLCYFEANLKALTNNPAK